MSPRLQRLATDWKTYAGLITGAGAGVTAVTDLLDKLAKAIAGVEHIPPEAKWLAAVLFAALSVLTLVAVLGRRSTLLRPERFVISADDPEHLVGRDEEVKALAKECERNALVFLQGESGAGKSALVLGGLIPHYQVTRAGNDAPRLLPIRIDASPLSWDNGLRIELARAINGLSADERAQLGAAIAVESDDAFSWLSALPRHASRQVLLVLDQIDDYAVAHQARFVSDHTVAAPEKFEAANADWAAIGSLLRKGSIHVLIVCRADAAGILDALRFTRATTFLLPRVDQQLISPILDRVTQADEGAPVVADPEHGWLQLKAQLLRDLAADGSQILPVQLAIGLDSVRRFRALTPAEYAKNGGARGLERLHIERHLHDAARAAGLGDDALLRGLMCLVAENGLKTKRATLQEFAQAIGVTGPGAAALETVVEHLIRWRILRRQSGAEGEYLLLHHDYLARGVREVQRQANYWVELLRERARELEEAFGWRQRWRALLPLIAQARLFWGRLRGRFRYGEHRRYAFWSMLRLLPVAAVLAGVIGADWWIDRGTQQQLAVEFLATVSPNREVSRDEAQKWRQFASARWPARFHAVQIALSNPSIAPKAIEKGALLAHVAVGLDPTGVLSHQLVRETIVPGLEKCEPPLCAARAAIAGQLRLARSETRAMARALVERAKSEHDGRTFWALGLALAQLSRMLDTEDVQPYAMALVERMKTEQFSGGLSQEGRVLELLSRKLDPKDVEPFAAALLERMKTEQDGDSLFFLAQALARMSDKLQAEHARPLAAALVERMKTERDSDALSSLGLALGGLSGKLDAKDLQPGVALLIERMRSEKNSRALSTLAEALTGLARHLKTEDARPLAVALEHAMITGDDIDAIPRMARAWVTLERIAYRKLDLQKRVQAYVDLLRLPLVVGDARKVLLYELDHITGERFKEDLWRFVDWAIESDRGKALRLDLGSS